MVVIFLFCFPFLLFLFGFVLFLFFSIKKKFVSGTMMNVRVNFYFELGQTLTMIFSYIATVYRKSILYVMA